MEKREWTGMEEGGKKWRASKWRILTFGKKEEGTDRGLTRSRVDDWRERMMDLAIGGEKCGNGWWRRGGRREDKKAE